MNEKPRTRFALGTVIVAILLGAIGVALARSGFLWIDIVGMSWCLAVTTILVTAIRSPVVAGSGLMVVGTLSAIVAPGLYYWWYPTWAILLVSSFLPLVAGAFFLARASRNLAVRWLFVLLLIAAFQTAFWFIEARSSIFTATPEVLVSIQKFRDWQCLEYTGQPQDHTDRWYLAICDEVAADLSQETFEQIRSGIEPFGAQLVSEDNMPKPELTIVYCPDVNWISPFLADFVTHSRHPSACNSGFRTPVLVAPGVWLPLCSGLAWVE